MTRSLDILKSIYKPYRYTINGKVTHLETTSGDFIIKEKGKDVRELFNYLESRNFYSYPRLVDASRSDVNVYEYIEGINMPNEQKCDDLIDVLASLHNKTVYFKEVSEDTYKAIYEDIKSNITYLKNYYETLFDKGFNEIYMAPSTYELMRGFSKIMGALSFSEEHLDNWYNLVKDETKSRVSVVHNNISLDHFLKNKQDYLISWDNYMVDTPIIDLVKLYKSTYYHLDFAPYLEKYLYKFPLLDSEKELLFILIALPPQVNAKTTEFSTCQEYTKMLDYVYKTEELIRPYYAKDQEEK